MKLASSLVIALVAAVGVIPAAMAQPASSGQESTQHSAAITGQGIDNFTGIIALPNCSASLVRFPNSQPTDKALMLTNGHCMPGGFVKPGVVVVNKSANVNATLLDANGGKKLAMRGTKILYGTMTGTDAAIFELDQTYADIKSKTQTDPFTFATEGPKVGDKLTVNSGYWKRIWHCSMSKKVFKLLEGGYENNDSIKYTAECDTIHGSSGSPILSDATGLVVGVNNTGNDEGGKCTENNPCEQDEQGNITYQKGWSYGQQTYWFNTCWTEARVLDLKKPGCLLPKPKG